MQETHGPPAFLKVLHICITILYNILEKGLKIQDSTLFDTTKLGFYPVENAVETVNNYWMD